MGMNNSLYIATGFKNRMPLCAVTFYRQNIKLHCYCHNNSQLLCNFAFYHNNTDNSQLCNCIFWFLVMLSRPLRLRLNYFR